MVCPQCSRRAPRRACPALGQRICPVCCGTKRLVEIACPPDCAYLAMAREHPAAPVVRQQQRDVGTLVEAMRDLGDRPAQLFLAVTAYVAQYEPAPLQPLYDADLVEAAGALAATFETASRGVIYDHRPGSAAAARLAGGLKPQLTEWGGRLGSAFERDAAAALRALEAAARRHRQAQPGSARGFLDLLGRLARSRAGSRSAGDEAPEEQPRLIVP